MNPDIHVDLTAITHGTPPTDVNEWLEALPLDLGESVPFRQSTPPGPGCVHAIAQLHAGDHFVGAADHR